MISHQQHTNRGFTLIELIVSLAIISMMMFLINRIFFDTSEAVSRGIATSKIIGNARTISEQLRADSELMIGPSVSKTETAGFLVIVNKEYLNTPYLDGRERGRIVNQTMKSGRAPRTVRSDQLCFIRRRGSAVPLTPTDPSNTGYAGSTDANYSRAWYGHIRQYPDENTFPADASPNDDDDLGQPDTPDHYANQWVLGRQLLFFDNHVSTTNRYIKYINWYSNQTSPTSFYYGVSDVLNTGYARYPQNDTIYTGASLPNSEILTLLDDYAKNSATDYKRYILGYTNNAQFVFHKNRLAANTHLSTNSIDADHIASMHPYFVSNLSDFIVEFAGDYNSLLGMAGEPDTNATGKIIWYGYGTDPPSTEPPFSGTIYPTGYNPPIDYDNDLLASGHSPTLIDHAYIFRHDDINLWPYLLRIRYRLHDPKGELMGQSADGTKTESGKWFETIIKVNRP